MSTPPLALIAEIACELEVGYRVLSMRLAAHIQHLDEPRIHTD